MSNRQPDLVSVLQKITNRESRGQPSSIDDVADELRMPGPYTAVLQPLLYAAERDRLVWIVGRDGLGDPFYALSEAGARTLEHAAT